MKDLKGNDVMNWFDEQVRPFLQSHAPEKLASLQNDYDRLLRIMSRPDDVTVCFLGNSGVGKSTLLNALAADDAQVLPAGGIGPLTAQATEVHYSEVPMFRVVYHPKSRLWQTVFALEARLTQQSKQAAKLESEAQASELAQELSEEEKREAIDDAASNSVGAEEGAAVDSLDGYIKQAKNIVCGNQFAEHPLEYLVDALRVACDLETKWGSSIDAQDVPRISRVKRILAAGKDGLKYERRAQGDKREFMEDLKAHAAGFLSPMIERIEVGWPADVLKAGVKLVDLPGVGIAQDSYRDVTKQYVREKARAVIVVVDRAGHQHRGQDVGYHEGENRRDGRLIGLGVGHAVLIAQREQVLRRVGDDGGEERIVLIVALAVGVRVGEAVHRRDGEDRVAEFDGFDLPLFHEVDELAVGDLAGRFRRARLVEHDGEVVDADGEQQCPQHDRPHTPAAAAVFVVAFVAVVLIHDVPPVRRQKNAKARTF